MFLTWLIEICPIRRTLLKKIEKKIIINNKETWPGRYNKNGIRNESDPIRKIFRYYLDHHIFIMKWTPKTVTIINTHFKDFPSPYKK